MEEPKSIPELLDRTLRAKRQSERAASLYMGVAPNAVNWWRKRGRNPDAESCRKIAAWSGYTEAFVLQLAGHGASDQKADPLQTLGIEIIPEIGVILRHFTPAEQRRYALPALELAQTLREPMEDEEADAPEQDPPLEGPPPTLRRRKPRR